VVEAQGDKIMEHPVGTGPFRLAQWRRSSRIVLERNPNYHDDFYDAQPNDDDAAGQALLARFKGRRLPMLDRVEIDIIEESQPRWLSFLNGEQDFLERLPNDFINQAVPGGVVAPSLAKRGVQALQTPAADTTLTVFNMEDPLVGGYTPDKVALRRAMVLGNDVAREIRLARRGQAIPAQSIMPPLTLGYRAGLRTESSEFSVPRAKALLELYGYVDRDGDGWRERPDGSPLVLEMATQSDQGQRQLDELWKKNMDALGVRIEFKTAKWPENLKASRAGKLMMWGVGWNGGLPDGDTFLGLSYAGNKGQANHARFDLPAYNELYERQRVLPDGPERLALMKQAARLLAVYVPAKFHVHRIGTDLAQPWVRGYSHHTFNGLFWKYVDIDAAAQPRMAGAA